MAPKLGPANAYSLDTMAIDLGREQQLASRRLSNDLAFMLKLIK